jgi:PPOX class probable F420-dependent enzyme
MPSQRGRIIMSESERRRFLQEERTLTCATIGPNGRPHLAPLWYLVDGEQLLCWTYAKSQKTRNLERDPRATVQVEAGRTYPELRGVLLECDVEIERDPERVLAAGVALATRHAGIQPDAETRDAIAGQSAKRVVLRFTPTGVASWDHRKLGA